MIRFILNSVPRGVLQRLAGWMTPVAGLFYAVGRGKRGGPKGVECPLCGGRYRRFMPYGYIEVRKNALCPCCLALERHRLLWLWLTRETDLISPITNYELQIDDKEAIVVKNGHMQGLRKNSRGSLPDVNDRADFERNAADGRFSRQFLHIAPEVCLSRRFEKIFPPDSYITADLESPLAKVKMDVQAIPFPDDSFDIIFCNHVLEHVADDRLAMREMWRVMRPGGWGVMLSPVDEARATTFEDDSITDPAERTRVFGQYDHWRVYGRDYADRLREKTGWMVEEIDYFTSLTPEERRNYGLKKEILYIVKKSPMKKLLLIFAALFAAATTVQAQTLPELPSWDDYPAVSRMSTDSRGFYMDGTPITVKEAKDYARPYRQALRHIRRGQGWEVGAIFMASAGGAAIGTEIGLALTGERISGTGIVLGLAFVGGGFGLEFIAISQYRKAASAYNSATEIVGLPPARETTLALATTGGGIGLQLTF